MRPSIKKALISALILSFALAIYNIWVQPMWEESLKAQGKSIGVAETAMGYFITILITYIINHYVTKDLDVK